MSKDSNTKNSERKRIRLSVSAKVALGVSAFLVVVGASVGSVLVVRSVSSIREIVTGKMLDIANSAALMLDGDELGSLTILDKGGEIYFDAYEARKPEVERHVTQEGVDSITVSEALSDIGALPFGQRERRKVEVRGYVTDVTEPYSEKHGSISFCVADDASSADVIYIPDFEMEEVDYAKVVHGAKVTITGFLESRFDEDHLSFPCLAANSLPYDHNNDTLATFRTSAERNNAEFAYIYCLKRVSLHHYVFSIDPSDDPGIFLTEETIDTVALEKAFSEARPTVDMEAYVDRWGRYYTAYSPIFDSQGDVAVVVAVDVNANWFDNTIIDGAVSVAISTGVIVLLGVVVSLLVTSRLRKRLEAVSNDMKQLEGDVDELLKNMKTDHMPVAEEKEHEGDHLNSIRERIHVTQSELKKYIEYARAQAFIDSLTGLGNRTAYIDRIKAINENFKNNFSVVVLDINGLKQINDVYGHEVGDLSIISTGECIRTAFPDQLAYRIGGDEFVVLLDYSNKERIDEAFDTFAKAVDSHNEGEEKLPFTLSVSLGYSCVNFESDTSFADVFKRADGAMYEVKSAYHKKQS